MSQLRSTSRVQARIGGGPANVVLEQLRLVEGVAKADCLDNKGNDTNGFLIEFVDGFNGSHLISRMTAERKWDLYELAPMKMSLEDIFIRIVTEEESKV
jgi:hypothetical protein